MAPPKPVSSQTPAPAPAPTPAKPEGGQAPGAQPAQVKAAAQVEVKAGEKKAPAQGKPSAPQTPAAAPQDSYQGPEDKAADDKNKKDAFRWNNWRSYELELGGGYECQNFNNGVGLFNDHCGGQFKVKPMKHIYLTPDDKHQLNVGLGFSYSDVTHDVPVAEGLEPDVSEATVTTFGPFVEYMFHPHEHFGAGLGIELGGAWYSSQQGEQDPETGEFPKGQYGVLVNANGDPTGRGANPYPWDASGFNLALYANISTLNGFLNIQPTVFWRPGVSMDVDTVTQGSFSQPVNPSGFLINFSGRFFGLADLLGREADKKKAKKADEASKKQASAKPAAPAPAAPVVAKPEVKKEPTVAERFTTLAAYKGTLVDMVEGNKETKFKGIKEIETEFNAVIKADASALGGQEAKDAKVAELAEQANRLALAIQVMFASAHDEEGRLLKQISGMPEGKEKQEAVEKLKAADAEFQVDKDKKTTTMAERVNEAYLIQQGVKNAYEAYAKKNKGVPAVEFDAEKPATLTEDVKPAPKAQPKSQPKAQPKSQPKSEPKAQPKSESKPEPKVVDPRIEDPFAE